MYLGDCKELSVGDIVTGQVRKIILDECALVSLGAGSLGRVDIMTTAMILSATEQLTPSSSVFMHSFWL